MKFKNILYSFIIYPIAFKNAASPLLLCIFIPSQRGINTLSKASIP